MNKIKIEKGIPIPLKRKTRIKGEFLSYPWKHMKVGDSFVVPIEKFNTIKVGIIHQNHHSKEGRHYLMRVIKDQCRVWRDK